MIAKSFFAMEPAGLSPNLSQATSLMMGILARSTIVSPACQHIPFCHTGPVLPALWRRGAWARAKEAFSNATLMVTLLGRVSVKLFRGRRPVMQKGKTKTVMARSTRRGRIVFAAMATYPPNWERHVMMAVQRTAMHAPPNVKSSAGPTSIPTVVGHVRCSVVAM